MPNPPESRHVLIVEDDADLLETFLLVLEGAGHVATGAGNGQEALDKLRGGLRPDLILLDLMMPVMNGWQFREEQLKDPALASIPVVVVSAAGPISETHTLHPAAFLPKPVDLEALLEIVGRAGQ